MLTPLYQIPDAVSVHGISQLDLGGDLVSFGYGDVPHVVTKTCNLEALSVVPGAGRAHPCAHFRVDLGILPVADDNFGMKPHPGPDESELPVAVSRLIQIHKVHVDRRPG